MKSILTALVLLVCVNAHAQIYSTNGICIVEPFATQNQFSTNLLIANNLNGGFYILDGISNTISKMAIDGSLSIFVGGGSGGFSGTGTNVSLAYDSFCSLVPDSSGNLWLTAVRQSSCYLLKITSGGQVSIENVDLPGGPSNPGMRQFCTDTAGNIYYDYGFALLYSYPASQINRYSPDSDAVNPFAVVPFITFVGQNSVAMASDNANNIYIWNSGDYSVWKIDQSGNYRPITYSTNEMGYVSRPAIANVSAMVCDPSGNLFLACGTCIREVDTNGVVTTIAGSFTQSGNQDGAGATALFSGANSLCLTPDAIIVADSGNQRIRKILINAAPVGGASVNINTFAGVNINGLTNRAYQVQSSTNMADWRTESTIFVTATPYLWIDPAPIAGNKFYRANLLP